MMEEPVTLGGGGGAAAAEFDAVGVEELADGVEEVDVEEVDVEEGDVEEGTVTVSGKGFRTLVFGFPNLNPNPNPSPKANPNVNPNPYRGVEVVPSEASPASTVLVGPRPVVCRHGHNFELVGCAWRDWICENVVNGSTCCSGWEPEDGYLHAYTNSYRCHRCNIDICDKCWQYHSLRGVPVRKNKVLLRWGSYAFTWDARAKAKCKAICKPILTTTIVLLMLTGFIVTIVAAGVNLDGGQSGENSDQGGDACFAAGTRIMLPSLGLRGPHTKAIEDIRVGETIHGGGKVVATLKLLGDGARMYDVWGAQISGSHAVRLPGTDAFTRVADAAGATEVPGAPPAFIYNLITEHHRIMVRADGESIEAADYMEVDDTKDILDAAILKLNGAEVPVDIILGLANTGEAQELHGSCFPGGSSVFLEDGSGTANIELIEPGQRVLHGGAVLGTLRLAGEAMVKLPSGAIVCGSIAVRDDRDGVWRRAGDVPGAVKLEGGGPAFSLITEHHRVLADTGAGELLAADFIEVDEDARLGAHNLALLNVASAKAQAQA